MPAARILLVHYDPRTLERFRKLLQNNGFQADEARDGGAAVTVLLESEPDLVLVEAMLPKVSGFEICADLKKTRHGRKIPILVMSAVYKGRKYRNDAIHTYGADEYLELPLDDAQFIAAIERALKAGSRSASGIQAGS
jgi:DNA-binding response OmpR family regulator